MPALAHRSPAAVLSSSRNTASPAVCGLHLPEPSDLKYKSLTTTIQLAESLITTPPSMLLRAHHLSTSLHSGPAEQPSLAAVATVRDADHAAVSQSHHHQQLQQGGQRAIGEQPKIPLRRTALHLLIISPTFCTPSPHFSLFCIVLRE